MPPSASPGAKLHTLDEVLWLLGANAAIQLICSSVLLTQWGYEMKRDQEISRQPQESRTHSADRLDWISKYLELADKIIQTHMPEGRDQRSDS